MAAPGTNNPDVMRMSIQICDGDERKAAAATGVASARLLGMIGLGYSDEQFDSALANTLRIFEETARQERQFWKDWKDPKDGHQAKT